MASTTPPGRSSPARAGSSGRRRPSRGMPRDAPGVPPASWDGDEMNALVVLTLVSVLGAAALFVALALFLRAISQELEDIGGPATSFRTPDAYLAKIRLGVRAIETQTAATAPQVTRLNQGLSAVRDGLRAIDANLAGVIRAVSRQGQR